MARFDRSDRLDAGLRFDEPDAPIPTPQKKSKRMSLFKLDLKSKDVPSKLALGAAHIAAMTGNTTYPTATRVPSDATVAAAQAALQTAAQEADAAETVWKQKNALRNAAEDAWDTVITSRANHCESLTPGDVPALTSTALPMRAAPVPAGPLGAPQNLRATAGDMEGQVDLMWDPLKGSSSNVIEQRAQGGAAAWSQAGIVQQSRFTADGLTPGTLYEFRVHGVGKDGNGPWSDTAVKRAS